MPEHVGREKLRTADTAGLSPLKRAYLALEQSHARIAQLEQAAREPIAVIGMGCRVPGADDVEGFWRLLRDGVDAISPVPADRWDIDALYDPIPMPGRIATRQGGFLRRVDEFDPAFFGIAPREAQGMDPQQRLLLEVAWETLEHAAQAPDRLEHSRTGVSIGACEQRLRLSAAAKRRTPCSMPTSHPASRTASLSGRLSYLLGLQGPSVTVDTACSSSLVAVHLACQALRSGECAHGAGRRRQPDPVARSRHRAVALAHARARRSLQDFRCRGRRLRTRAKAAAWSCSSGCRMRRRMATAMLAVIRGSAVNQDGPSSGLTAPNGPAQEAVIREALARAGLDAASRWATSRRMAPAPQLGDPLEVQALSAVFGRDRAPAISRW